MIQTSAILSRRGFSQCTLHSQWLSKNVNTGPAAASAPRTRDRTRPGNVQRTNTVRKITIICVRVCMMAYVFVYVWVCVYVCVAQIIMLLKTYFVKSFLLTLVFNYSLICIISEQKTISRRQDHRQTSIRGTAAMT